jgi:hypothetical protein
VCDVGERLEGLGHCGGVGEVEVDVDDVVGIRGGGGARSRGLGWERGVGECIDLPWPLRDGRAREDVEEGGANDACGVDNQGHIPERRSISSRLLIEP